MDTSSIRGDLVMATINKTSIPPPCPVVFRKPTALSLPSAPSPKPQPPLFLLRSQTKLLAYVSSSPPIPTQNLPNPTQSPNAAGTTLAVVIVGAIAIGIRLSKLLASKRPQFSLKLEGTMPNPDGSVDGTPFSLEMVYWGTGNDDPRSRVWSEPPWYESTPVMFMTAVLFTTPIGPMAVALAAWALVNWFANIPWEPMSHLCVSLLRGIIPPLYSSGFAFLLLDVLWHLARPSRSH